MKDNLEDVYFGKFNDYCRENELWNIGDYRFGGEPIWREESTRNIKGVLWEKSYKRKVDDILWQFSLRKSGNTWQETLGCQFVLKMDIITII